MKKIYYILSFVFATGLFASCSNDINGMEELFPGNDTELPGANETRAFAEDDGARGMRGNAATKLYTLLTKADEIFYTKKANYTITDEQFAEIKAFTDELVSDKNTPETKYKTIFSWLVKNIKYNNTDTPYSNEPYDVFKNKICVCQGYSNLLNVMALSQEIPVINANGLFHGMGHAWNYVKYNGKWFLSDATNNIEYLAANYSEYVSTHGYTPTHADGIIVENDLYAYSFEYEQINLKSVKVADDAFIVPFSVSFGDGSKYKLTSFDPSTDLPSNVKEIYIGKNIEHLGANNLIGLNDHAPNVEAAYVAPENSHFTSYAGVVYQKKSTSPLYIPAAMMRVELIPAETYGKETLKGHKNVREIVFPSGTKRIENWAVEKCPNLLAAYVPVDTEVDENAFTGCHAEFRIIREDQTGIKDVIAD